MGDVVVVTNAMSLLCDVVVINNSRGPFSAGTKGTEGEGLSGRSGWIASVCN